MLTRQGSSPGPVWMRRLNATLLSRSAPRHLAWFIPAVILFSVGLGNILRVIPQPYESTARIAGLPLLALGAAPHGIIAFGGRATGVIAIGGIAVGVVAIGGLALGAFALSGVTLGLFAVGGGAVGWWALGGCAVGNYAFGGLAVGSYAYAGGGIALGRHEASGGQKERLIG
jgi:hypothetical protein